MAKAAMFEKDLPEEERFFYYESTEDDPIKTETQEKTHNKVELYDGYKYIKKNPFARLYGIILYYIFKLFARWYARFYLHMKMENRKVIKKAKKTGYVIYANHTNPFHDLLSPALVADRHIYTICSPANLDVPFFGKLLPYLGALPLGKNPEQKAEFHAAIDTRIKQGNCLVIYPEAHVWPYYTGIRKFPAGDRSFKYPVRNNVPIFTMTTTYHKSKKKGQARPDMIVYIDGPFYPDPKKNDDENRADLAQKAYDSMVKYSKKNTYEYIQYRKKSTKKS